MNNNTQTENKEVSSSLNINSQKRIISLLCVLALLVCWLPALAAPASAAEAETYEIWGAWVLNSELTYVPLEEYVNFGVSDPDIQEYAQLITGLNSGKMYLIGKEEGAETGTNLTGFLSKADDGVKYLLSSGTLTSIYFKDPPTLYFGSAPQVVSAELYNWILENATPPEGFFRVEGYVDLFNPSGITEIYDSYGEFPVTISVNSDGLTFEWNDGVKTYFRYSGANSFTGISAVAGNTKPTYPVGVTYEMSEPGPLYINYDAAYINDAVPSIGDGLSGLIGSLGDLLDSLINGNLVLLLPAFVFPISAGVVLFVIRKGKRSY